MSIDLQRYSHLRTFVKDETLPSYFFKEARIHHFPKYVAPLPLPEPCSLRWIMYNMDKVTSPFIVKACKRFTQAEIAPDTEILIIGKTLYGLNWVAVIGVPCIGTKFYTECAIAISLDTVGFYPMWISCKGGVPPGSGSPILWILTVNLHVLPQKDRPRPCLRCNPQMKCPKCHRENMICDRCGHSIVVTEFLHDSMLCELCDNELVE